MCLLSGQAWQAVEGLLVVVELPDTSLSLGVKKVREKQEFPYFWACESWVVGSGAVFWAKQEWNWD